MTKGPEADARRLDDYRGNLSGFGPAHVADMLETVFKGFYAVCAERDKLKAQRDRLIEVLRQIERGNSFPEDEVQRAKATVARAAIAEIERDHDANPT